MRLKSWIITLVATVFINRMGLADAIPPADPTVSVPLHYVDQAMIVSAKGCTVIFRFNSTDDGNGKRGAHFHYRLLPSQGGEVKGEGDVFENYQRRTSGTTSAVIDLGSRLKIVAGKIELPWSLGGIDFGWVYFVPEDATVELLNNDEFDKLDLTRFKR